MSRYPPSDYRGARERSRSPPRFSDRRGSAVAPFDGRPAGPPRSASDAPRGPRSQFDNRPPLSSTLGSGPGARPGYSSLRDAPPLGTGPDRGGRPFRDREYDRRDRLPSPRERSPPRAFKDARDYPPRDIDTVRSRRGSRDGPLSAGPAYSDNQSYSPQPIRGGFGRGRGRGDFDFRGRGGRRPIDDRRPIEDRSDLFRRDRSPPPGRWGRDDRDDRRFDRDDRRPDWADREREIDRSRRDPPPPRPDGRPAADSTSNPTTPYQASPIAPIDPGRLALIEGSGTDGGPPRRPSVAQNAPAPQARRDVPETPAYLNGRAETTANRYNQRGSSPPTQAPPVPAFSFAPTAPAAGNGPSPTTSRNPQEQTSPSLGGPEKSPAQSKAPPPAPRSQNAEPPPSAPRAPRALEQDPSMNSANRLQGVRSLENMAGPNQNAQLPHGSPPTGPSAMSPRSHQSMPILAQPVSPEMRRQDFVAPPTGPRASRPSQSPRIPPHVSPRLDGGQGFGTLPRGQTPPPGIPSGPRHGSFSVSPQVANSAIPTAPKANRGPPVAPRGPDRGPGRAQDRFGGQQPWAPPTAPRGSQWNQTPNQNQQWNQWKRPGAPAGPNYMDKTVPAKRDSTGEEKQAEPKDDQDIKSEEPRRFSVSDKMDIDGEVRDRAKGSISGHSARQSFFGKPTEGEAEPGISDAVEEATSSSEDDELNPEEDVALFNAKFERQKRTLEAQLVDLSAREYRSTTPLESIARLANITTADLQKFNETRKMQVDEEPAPPSRTSARVQPSATNTSESDDGPDIVTPQGEDDSRVAIRDSDDGMEQRIRRVRRPTPEVISLPYLTKDPKPFHESEVFSEGTKRHEETGPALLSAMQEEVDEDREMTGDTDAEFAQLYRIWREQCEDMDRDRELRERQERQLSIEPVPDLDASATVLANTTSESRRGYKNSSEYEIEQVLRQSEETARLEAERAERDRSNVQANMDKEALLPDQMTEKEFILSSFIDTNRLRDPDNLTQVFSYEPPADTFTENEQQIFIAAFKETPKKWGEIASLLPGRDYKDCIHHYYANKWDNRFRDARTKRFKGGRGRGRGGKSGLRGRGSALMADLGRSEEISQVSDSGRPKRAAAPTTFGERESDARAALLNPSPNKKGAKGDANGESGPDKPAKRRKGMGEKPGRKPKGSQPLAALAAAPSASPNKAFAQGVHTKEEIARAQNLEDASLLAGLQGGHHGMFPADGQAVYTQDGFVRAMPPNEEAPRSKAAAAGTKTSASSYWSVPEQTDFAKYIAHFGTDFAAIAAHMGTKTQTMIKNHYMRQIDGGSRSDLEQAAKQANKRREEGQDMGAPPTPTPIVKRKYDNPGPAAQRTLAPHKDAMDIDERTQTGKHTSPPGYGQGRFATPAQGAPIPGQRMQPSPVAAAVTPNGTQVQAATSRPNQHPLGSRLAFMADARPESRPGMQTTPGFRVSQDTPPVGMRGHASPVGHQPNSDYLRNLVQEQDRAFRMQQEQSQQDRIDALQRQPASMHRSAHGSPANQPLPNPSDRMHFKEERPMSPPRNDFSPGLSRGMPGQSMYAPPGSAPYGSAMPPRGPYAGSPVKEHQRPGSVPGSNFGPPPSTTPAPEPPKRSNLFGILNSEPEEPKKVINPPPRAESPGPSRYATPAPGQPRREAFGQPTAPKSQLHRMSFGQSSQGPTPSPISALKHEPLSAGSQGGGKLDWTSHVYRQPAQRQPSPPPERDSRGYYSRFGQPPANPSPPPHAGGHSRTSSLTMQGAPGSRKAPGSNPSRQATPHQNIPPYGQPPAYHQPPPTTQPQSHSHHASMGSYGGMHHRGLSTDDPARRQQEEQMYAQRQHPDERDWKRRDDERRDRDYHAQRQEQERQQGYGRGPAPPMHPQYGGGAYEQQMRAQEEHHRDAERRYQHDTAMRDREIDEQRRRQDEAMYRGGRTPLGGSGGYGPPPPARR